MGPGGGLRGTGTGVEGGRDQGGSKENAEKGKGEKETQLRGQTEEAGRDTPTQAQ